MLDNWCSTAVPTQDLRPRDELAIDQPDSRAITTMPTRTQPVSIITWLALAVFVLALGVAVSLFWSAYVQKQRALISVEDGSEEPRHYFKVAIVDMPANHYTHVEITGMVKSVQPQKDGDTHVRVFDGADFVIAECIPKLPCSVIPDVGQTVTIRGVSRYDRENHWYEVHPVEEIEVKR